MIPAYSPQARGRTERSFATWQGRLPQELRLRGIRSVEEANRFLREEYIAEFNRRFSVPAAQPGSAFLSLQGQDLDRIFSVQHERVVGRYSAEGRALPIPGAKHTPQKRRDFGKGLALPPARPLQEVQNAKRTLHVL